MKVRSYHINMQAALLFVVVVCMLAVITSGFRLKGPASVCHRRTRSLRMAHYDYLVIGAGSGGNGVCASSCCLRGEGGSN